MPGGGLSPGTGRTGGLLCCCDAAAGLRSPCPVHPDTAGPRKACVLRWRTRTRRMEREARTHRSGPGRVPAPRAVEPTPAPGSSRGLRRTSRRPWRPASSWALRLRRNSMRPGSASTAPSRTVLGRTTTSPVAWRGAAPRPAGSTRGRGYDAGEGDTVSRWSLEVYARPDVRWHPPGRGWGHPLAAPVRGWEPLHRGLGRWHLRGRRKRGMAGPGRECPVVMGGGPHRRGRTGPDDRWGLHTPWWRVGPLRGTRLRSVLLRPDGNRPCPTGRGCPLGPGDPVLQSLWLGDLPGRAGGRGLPGCLHPGPASAATGGPVRRLGLTALVLLGCADGPCPGERCTAEGVRPPLASGGDTPDPDTPVLVSHFRPASGPAQSPDLRGVLPSAEELRAVEADPGVLATSGRMAGGPASGGPARAPLRRGLAHPRRPVRDQLLRVRHAEGRPHRGARLRSGRGRGAPAPDGLGRDHRPAVARDPHDRPHASPAAPSRSLARRVHFRQRSLAGGPVHGWPSGGGGARDERTVVAVPDLRVQQEPDPGCGCRAAHRLCGPAGPGDHGRPAWRDRLRGCGADSPECIGCHSALDPMAATIRASTRTIRTRDRETHRYHPEREHEVRRTRAFPRVVRYSRDDLGILRGRVGRAFLPCTVSQVAQGLWGRAPRPSDDAELAGVVEAFEAGDQRLPVALAAIMDGPTYQAGSQGAEGREITARWLWPDQLSTALEAATGFHWTWLGFELLDDDTIGYRVLMVGSRAWRRPRRRTDRGSRWPLETRRRGCGSRSPPNWGRCPAPVSSRASLSRPHRDRHRHGAGQSPVASPRRPGSGCRADWSRCVRGRGPGRPGRGVARRRGGPSS